MVDVGPEADKSHWPAGVKSITIGNIEKLGVDERTNKLYFDGRALMFESRLALPERLLATVGVLSAVVMAVVEVGRSFGWWGG